MLSANEELKKLRKLARALGVEVEPGGDPDYFAEPYTPPVWLGFGWWTQKTRKWHYGGTPWTEKEALEKGILHAQT